MDVYERLKELNLTLPEHPLPGTGILKPIVQVGNLLYTSGQGPLKDGIVMFTGKVGAERNVEEGQEAARLCVMNILSKLHHFLGGDLNKIKRLVKTLGLVQSADGFSQQSNVINGASALLRDIWGEENGVGTRSAIGVPELPRNFCVEIEFIFELK